VSKQKSQIETQIPKDVTFGPPCKFHYTAVTNFTPDNKINWKSKNNNNKPGFYSAEKLRNWSYGRMRGEGQK